MRRLRLVLFFILVITPGKLFAGPQWTTDSAVLGNVNLDGSLALSIPLLTPASAPKFGLTLTLLHSVNEASAMPSETWARLNYPRGLSNLTPLPNF